MNLLKLAKFVILIWLPLASLKLSEKEQTKNLLYRSKKTLVDFEHEKKGVVENIAWKKMEENSSKKQKNRLIFLMTEDSISGNFYKRFSANSLNLKSENNVHKKGIATSAHKLKINVKKGLSALMIGSVKNISATKFKYYLKNKIKNFKPKIRKREAFMGISTGEDPHSLEDYEEEDAEDLEMRNSTEVGSLLGAPCEMTCSEKLLHVSCNPTSRICECDDKYPVQIDARIGCEKPKQLGDQCFYAETCSFFDSNAVCMQIHHNAICQCKPGFHTVALRKGVKRMFCSEDAPVVSADLSTLLGVATGIAVLTGLICFVLRLFSGNRYPSARHYANSNIAPPLLLSNDNQWINGIPLTVHGRPPSRSSCQRSTMNLAQYSRNKGVLVPASRAGAARAAAILLIPCHLQASRHSEVTNNSNIDDSEVQQNDVEQTSRLGSRRHSFSSVHSTTSSQRSASYSARRFEQENLQREQRAAMRAAREETAKSTASFTPSPMSTDDMIIPFSKDTEEDPLCAQGEDSPPESGPPAFSINSSPSVCSSDRCCTELSKAVKSKCLGKTKEIQLFELFEEIQSFEEEDLNNEKFI